MSHFTLLVIGKEDIEGQLEPFLELDLDREELMEDNRAIFNKELAVKDLKKEFEKFKEEHKEEIKKEKEDYWIKYKTCSTEEWLDSWKGYYLNKKETHYGYYTNPNAKWDWYEKGDMGWFGISNETDEEAKKWNKNFYETFIKELKEGTLLTIVDCHI